MMLWQKERSNSLLYTDIFENRRTDPCGLPPLDKNIKDNRLAITCREKGNTYFEQGALSKAIELYNTSMCFAENGSQHLSFAYANRANCFLKMNKFQLCLNDIQLAKAFNYPMNKMLKLQKRQVECLKRMKSPYVLDLCEPKLSFDANPNTPCLAECLHVGATFREITADRDLAIGRNVIIEKPYCTALRTDWYLRCANCLMETQNKNLIPCKGCIGTMFCDQKCYDIAMAKFHTIECKMISHWKNSDKPASNGNEFLTLRSIVIALKVFSSVDQLINSVELFNKDHQDNQKQLTDPAKSEYRSFFMLNRYDRRISDCEIVLQYLHKQAYRVYGHLMNGIVNDMFSTERKQRFLMHLIVQHTRIVFANSIKLFKTAEMDAHTKLIDSCNIPYASGIYLISGNLPFSITPDLHGLSMGDRLIFKTLRPIKTGNSLTIAFGFHSIGEPPVFNLIPYRKDVSSDPDYKVAATIGMQTIRYALCLEENEREALRRTLIEFLGRIDKLHPTLETMFVQTVLCNLWNLKIIKN